MEKASNTHSQGESEKWNERDREEKDVPVPVPCALTEDVVATELTSGEDVQHFEFTSSPRWGALTLTCLAVCLCYLDSHLLAFYLFGPDRMPRTVNWIAIFRKVNHPVRISLWGGQTSHLSSNVSSHPQDNPRAPAMTSFNVTQVTSKQQHHPTSCNQVSVMPHPISKLRFIQYAVPENESHQERELRLRRIELQEWNHQYWSKINQEFIEEKEEYIEKVLKPTPDTEYSPTQSYEELAVFYKKFLDSRHQKHIGYNFEWYRRNLSLLWPSFIVQFVRLRRRLTSN